MKIGVISDTHDHLYHPILLRLEEMDEIWHLGDVCDESILDDLRGLGKPLHWVRGNCDFCSDWPIILVREVDGLKFYLVHIPPDECPEEVDCLLHGHTHVPRDEMVKGVRFLNPGTLGRPNKGAPASYGVIETFGGGKMSWRVELV